MSLKASHLEGRAYVFKYFDGPRCIGETVACPTCLVFCPICGSVARAYIPPCDGLQDFVVGKSNGQLKNGFSLVKDVGGVVYVSHNFRPAWSDNKCPIILADSSGYCSDVKTFLRYSGDVFVDLSSPYLRVAGFHIITCSISGRNFYAWLCPPTPEVICGGWISESDLRIAKNSPRYKDLLDICGSEKGEEFLCYQHRLKVSTDAFLMILNPSHASTVSSSVLDVIVRYGRLTDVLSAASKVAQAELDRRKKTVAVPMRTRGGRVR